jgi:hypothetical protein
MSQNEIDTETSTMDVPETVEEALEELQAEGGISTKKLIAAGVLVVALIGMGVSYWRMKKTKEVEDLPIVDAKD